MNSNILAVLIFFAGIVASIMTENNFFLLIWLFIGFIGVEE